MDRLSQLKQFMAEEPDDPFNAYALALEYMKSDPAESMRIFENLAIQHPQYLPTYYPYAHLLIEQNNNGKADEIFERGISMARRCNEAKTLRELQSAYQDWKFA